MKKVNSIFIAAFVAASAMFVSCDPTEEPDEPSVPPTITVNLNGTDQSTITVKADETVTMKIDWKAEAGLKEVKLAVVDGNSVSPYPKTSGFSPSNNHESLTGHIVSTPNGFDGGTVKFIAEVKDQNDAPKNQEIVITFTKVEPPFEFGPVVDLGGQDGSTGSFYSISQGRLNITNATSQSSSVDFAYFYGATNQATIAAPADADAQTITYGSTRMSSWSTKNSTKFFKVANANGSKPEEWWDANIDKATTDTKANMLTVGTVVIFQTTGGTKGAFVVEKVTGTQAGSIEIKFIKKK